jgi:hypothetical protein
MKAELQKKLFDKFPKLFAQRDLNMKQTCMCWGIECPSEWYDVIYAVCDHIQGMIDCNNDLSDRYPQIEFTQVKEKYGALCMYYNNSVDYYDGVIEMASRVVQLQDKQQNKNRIWHAQETNKPKKKSKKTNQHRLDKK